MKRGSLERKKAQKNPSSTGASRGALREPSRQGAAWTGSAGVPRLQRGRSAGASGETAPRAPPARPSRLSFLGFASAQEVTKGRLRRRGRNAFRRQAGWAKLQKVRATPKSYQSYDGTWGDGWEEADARQTVALRRHQRLVVVALCTCSSDTKRRGCLYCCRILPSTTTA